MYLFLYKKSYCHWYSDLRWVKWSDANIRFVCSATSPPPAIRLRKTFKLRKIFLFIFIIKEKILFTQSYADFLGLVWSYSNIKKFELDNWNYDRILQPVVLIQNYFEIASIRTRKTFKLRQILVFFVLFVEKYNFLINMYAFF